MKERKRKELCVSEYEEAMRRQVEKQKDSFVQGLLQRRKAIVEPIFRGIKRAFGFWRWSQRGLEGVRAQWYWICTAFNLRKLYGLSVERKLVMAGG